MSAPINSLIERLRGKYVIPVDDGGGLLDGKDTFERTFPVPPINLEAANAIEALHKLIHHIYLHDNYSDCGFLQMETPQKKLFVSILEQSDMAECAESLKPFIA